jgi:quinoprotein glucose dehydrogenase
MKLVIAVVAALFLATSADHPSVDWPFWGGDTGSAHYSALTDINTGNVSQLRQAWVWKTARGPECSRILP